MKRLVETAPWKKKTADTQVTEEKPVAANENSQNFFKLDDPSLQVAFPKVHQAIQLIDAYSPLGKSVLDWSRAHNVVLIGETNAYNYGGLYTHSNGKITLSAQNSIEENLILIAHEFMHCVQFYRSDYQGDIWTSWYAYGSISYAIHVLVIEAAAEAFAVAVAHEAKLNGYAHGFDVASLDDNKKRTDKYKLQFDVFENVYHHVVNNGGGCAQASQQAIEAAYRAYFRMQTVIDIYNQRSLADYLSFQYDQIIRPVIPEIRMKRDFLQAAAYVGKDKDTALLYFPQTSSEIFGDNVVLRQAFEYADAVLCLPPNSDENYATVKKAARAVLEQDKNPFLGLNIWRALKLYNEQEKTAARSANMLTIMCELTAEQKVLREKESKVACVLAAKPS